MEVQQLMDMVASKEAVLQTKAQMAELEKDLGDLDRRYGGCTSKCYMRVVKIFSYAGANRFLLLT
jgi:hypothetical protein